MNLEQSDSFKSELERNARSKRNVVISLVFCSFLIVLLVVLIVFINYQDSITEKMFIDDVQVAIPNGFYKVIDGERYVNVRNLADMFGYTYTKGIYGEYTEDDDSCYLKSDYEIVALTAGSKKFTKYLEYKDGIQKPFGTVPNSGLFKHEQGYSESFNIAKPIKFEEGMLYVSQEYIPTMFNVQIDWQEYRIKFYTLNYMVGVAQKTMAANQITEMDASFENLRALNYGFIIVGNSTTGSGSTDFGVIRLGTGEEIISKKYEDIVFVENSQEFYITAGNGTIAILDSKGETVIPASEFEKISLLDQETKIYLVEKNGEYGVLNKKGEQIIFPEYDEIGIKLNDFAKDESENGALLFGKCIPVKKDGKYGLYGIDKTRLLDLVYDGFGYKAAIKSTSSGSEQSALLIPSYVGINGIVVNLDDKYGIFDVNVGGLILPTVFDKIYFVTREGERTYYISYKGNEIELSQYLKENNLNNVNENGELLTKDTSATPINEESPSEDVPANGETTEIQE